MQYRHTEPCPECDEGEVVFFVDDVNDEPWDDDEGECDMCFIVLTYGEVTNE